MTALEFSVRATTFIHATRLCLRSNGCADTDANGADLVHPSATVDGRRTIVSTCRKMEILLRPNHAFVAIQSLA